MDCVVYSDDDYPTWWISRALSKKITSFLSKNKFQVKDAKDLALWMESCVDKGTAHQSVVVFSQDVVPDTICHSPSPACLARAFLDLGGRMVWIGDNPFYYQGLSITAMKKFSSDQLVAMIRTGGLAQNKQGEFARHWSLNGPYGVLGVIPVFMSSPSEKVKITKRGKTSGLLTPWYGNRPVIKKGESFHRKLSVFGTSKPIYPISTKKILLQPEEERKISFPNILSSLSSLVGLVPAIATAGAAIFIFVTGWASTIVVPLIVTTVLLAAGYGVYWYSKLREAFASAWLKNFCDEYPNSGFLRIWDYEPYEISDKMLQDLLKIAVSQ